MKKYPMILRQGILLLISSSMMAALVACGGNHTTPVLPVSVAFSGTPPTSLMVGTTVSLTAVVTNDSANKGVTWSVTCSSTGTGACGSFSPATTASGAATTYTAPLALPSGGTVTVTATSVADSTKSVSSPAINIYTPNISVTFSKTAFPPNAVQVGGSAAIAAIVTGDTTHQGVSWSCSSAGGACGSFNPATTPSGVSTTYTAPVALPTGRTVTLTASSVTNPGDSTGIVGVFISAEPTTMADGTYVFSLAGTDKNGLYFVAGAFVVSSGAITSGEQDFIDSAVTKKDSIISGSYYAVDDGNLWITLKTADTSIGVSGVEILAATLVSSSKAQLIEFDSSATSSGTLDLQTSKAAPSRGYAFFTAGEDSGKSPTAIGGVINVDGSGTISGVGSVFDINDSGLPLPLPNQAFAASMVPPPDSMGRVVFSLVSGPGSSIGQINLVGYIVDASHIRLVETSDAYGGFTGGTALGQGTSTGTFNASSISGSSYVFGMGGTDANGALQVAGLLSAGSSGSVSGTLNFNDIAAQSPQGGNTLSAGSYTVDPTGRVTLKGLTDSSTSPTFNYNLQLYLTGDGHGVLISMDKAEVIAGLGFQQTGSGSFGLDSFSGSYGMNVAQVLLSASSESEQHAAGPITADGAGDLAGFADFSQISGTAGGNDLPFSGNLVANANGVFTGQISGLNLLSPSTPDNFTYYLVDKTRAVFIETDNTQLTLGYFALQQ